MDRPAKRKRGTVAPGEHALFLGLLALLAFSILMFTRWALQAWQVSAVQTGVYVLAICWAVRCPVLSIHWPTAWVQLPFLLACCWGLLQLATGRTVYRFATWSALLHWMALTLAFGVAYLSLQSPILLSRFRMFCIYFGGFLSIWVIVQLVSGEDKFLWMYPIEGIGRPIGPFGSRDHYATFIMLILAMALWAALTTRGSPILSGCIAACMYASILAAGSRAGSVLASFELIAILTIGIRGRHVALHRGSRKTGLGILVLTACAVVIVGVGYLFQRFQQPIIRLDRRLDLWISTLAMIRDHPWMGTGLGTWTLVYPGYASFDPGVFVNAAHNDWLQWAGDGGIPFALLMLIVAGRALQLGLREPWSLGITFAFLHCGIDFPLQRIPVFFWLVTILAAAEVSWVRDRGVGLPRGRESGAVRRTVATTVE